MTSLDKRKESLGGGQNSRPFLNGNANMLDALKIATGAANANRPYELNLNEITVDEQIQVRVGGLNEETVESYMAVLENGGELPPIKVFSDEDGDKWLADGFHRYAAHERVGKALIKAFVQEGSREQALDYAESANLEHGLKLSNEDKRNILFRRLERGHDWVHLSDGALAQILGVNKRTIARWIETFNSTMTNVTVDRSVVVGTDGKTRDTSKIGRQVSPSPAPAPAKPDDGYVPLPPEKRKELSEKSKSDFIQEKPLDKGEGAPQSDEEAAYLRKYAIESSLTDIYAGFQKLSEQKSVAILEYLTPQLREEILGTARRTILKAVEIMEMLETLDHDLTLAFWREIHWVDKSVWEAKRIVSERAIDDYLDDFKIKTLTSINWWKYTLEKNPDLIDGQLPALKEVDEAFLKFSEWIKNSADED